MIDIKISKFQLNQKFSVELEGFEPRDGLEAFVKAFTEYLREALLEWNRNWEFGVGRITFMGSEVILIQSEFPQVLSFDCPDETVAKELRHRLVRFFESEIGHHFV